MSFIPSGAQYEIKDSGYSAVVTEIGASLRRLRWGDRDLIVPFARDEVRPHYRGAILAPWPNRVVDGRYTFAGVEYQLPVTEPQRGHALHGLALWLGATIVEHLPSSVTLAMVIEPQDGYPFRVRVIVSYALGAIGLRVNVTATNLTDREAPFATAAHPYLVAPVGPLDEWTLSLPAARVLTVTPDRLIPVGLAPVEHVDGGAFDFRVPREIGATRIDHAFTDLSRDANGTTVVALTGRDARGVTLSWDHDSPWVQICTADLSTPFHSRLGLAVEPMSGPPDAFNSGAVTLVLGVGQSRSYEWRIAAIG
jgi:aldose 1-epimerase